MANPIVSGDTWKSIRDKINGVIDAAENVDISAAQAALYDGPWLGTVGLLLADTTLTYTPSTPSTVAAGGYVRTRAEGFSYRVAASTATDHHVVTAGGVKLYVQPGTRGHNAKAFGVIGDGTTDDSAAMQMAINACFNAGVTLFVPAGDYYCPSGIAVNYTTLLYGKPVIVGEGASNTRFSTNTNTTLLNISGDWGSSEQQRNQFSGFSLSYSGFSLSYSGSNSIGVGMALTELSYTGLSDIAINGFYKGLLATDVITLTFHKCMFVGNTVGVEGVRTTFSNANAWAFYACTINGNSLRGIQVNKAATLSLDSCTLEGNGTMSVTETYAVYMNGNPNEGASGLTARNCYFEGNKGEADVCIDANDGDGALHSFYGCTFNRISSVNFVTNNIKLVKSNTGFLGLTVNGCGFRHFNTYSPASNRRCIAFVGAIANDDYQVSLTENYFASTVDAPTIGGVASSQKAYTSAWARVVGATGAVAKSHNISSVSRLSTGRYTLTFSQSFKSAGHSVAVLPIGTLGFGALVAETASTITIETYNGASALTDWPAVSVIVHSE